jgi:hypothetical protein
MAKATDIAHSATHRAFTTVTAAGNCLIGLAPSTQVDSSAGITNTNTTCDVPSVTMCSGVNQLVATYTYTPQG